MSGVAQVTIARSIDLDPSPSVLRSPSSRRARPSMAGVADRATEASERAIAELTAMVGRLQFENAVLRGEVSQRDARLEEAAGASKAAMQAQAATIESQAATITDLRGEVANLQGKLDEATIKFARLDSIVAALNPLCYWTPGLPHGVREYTLHGDPKWKPK